MDARNVKQNQVPLLPLQADLMHRGGFGQDVASLIPPQGTFADLGGRVVVARLVDGLYDRIEADTVLRPAFNRDLVREREKQKQFFEAWFGGSDTYFHEWSWPGLKVRHARIFISRGMAGRWVGHFLDSLAETCPNPDVISRVKRFVIRLAMALVNRTSEPKAGEPLRRFCSSKDMERLLRIIQRDDATSIAEATLEHPQVLVEYGPRFLLIASVRGKGQAVKELLRQGVDVNVVESLPGSEASVHKLPTLQITPLCGALAKRRASVIQELIAQGAQYDIFTAAFLGDLDTLRELLDGTPELANVYDPACDVAQITPLVHAVAMGQVEVTRFLLQHGAEVGGSGLRLLQASANSGQEALTDLLLEHRADPTALGAGTWVLYPSLAEKLRGLGANVNRDPGAWIGMCCTGNSGHKENAAFARALLHYGADVNARYKGRTALHCAAKAGFAQIVAALIEYGADVRARDDAGLTPRGAVEEAGLSTDKESVRRLLSL